MSSSVLARQACPRCEAPLTTVRLAGRRIEECPICQGRAVNAGVVKALAGPALLRAIFGGSRPEVGGGALACPGCRHPMQIGFVQTAIEGTEIDFCVRCQLVWFDRGELSTPIEGTDGGRRAPKSIGANARERHNVRAATSLMLNNSHPIDYTPRSQLILRCIALVVCFVTLILVWHRDGADLGFAGIVSRSYGLLIALVLVWMAPYVAPYLGYVRRPFGLLYRFIDRDYVAYVYRSTPPIVLELAGVIFMLMVAYNLF